MARLEEPLIPLFPLPNVVLFPGMPLPLHVFEPRYREMVRDVEGIPTGPDFPKGGASSPEEKVIGMVLLRGDWRKDYHGNPQIFSVGCAGKMVNVEPLSDGCYNILLHGLREFEVQSEDTTRSYRRATVRWRPPGDRTLASDQRPKLEDLLGRLLASDPAGPQAKLLGDPGVTDETFVNFFCYALDLSPLEKQSLLEAQTLAARAARLVEVVEFALSAGPARPDGGDFRVH